MGTLKHHAIVVTYWRKDEVEIARNKALEIFNECFFIETGSDLISPIISGVVNTQCSFFIAPDGSKEGWDTSSTGDEARKRFLDWLRDHGNGCNYVEVVFGGDYDYADVLRHDGEERE